MRRCKLSKLIISTLFIFAIFGTIAFSATIDVVPPKGEVTITNATLEDGVYYTETKQLNLNITVSNEDTASLKMLMSNKPITGDEIINNSLWTSYENETTYIIPDGVETGEIYVYLKDSAGNISQNIIETTKEYIVSYVATGATNVPSAQTAKYGFPFEITAREPKMEGKYFIGWSTEENATERTYFSDGTIPASEITGNITLYAVWKDEPENISNVVKVGDFVNYPVTYTNVNTNGSSYKSSATEWRVLEIKDGVVKLISGGTPLAYAKTKSNTETLAELTTNFLNGTSSNYSAYGFAGNLEDVFDNKYTEKVESLKLTDVTTLTGTTSITNYDTKVHGEILDNETYYYIAGTEDTENLYYVDGQDNKIKLGTGTYGIKVVVTLSDKTVVTRRNEAGKWEIDTEEVEVTLDANGGILSETSVTYKYGENYTNLPVPTKTGYTFVGWYTAKTNGTKITDETKITNGETHTIYAMWEENTYTVNLNETSGSVTYNSTKSFTVTSSVAGKITVTPANSNVAITKGNGATLTANTASEVTYKGANATTSAVTITVTFTPTDTAKYLGKTITYTVNKVDPITITAPTGSTLTYNGSAQTGVASGTGYSITGNTETNAGSYTATASLISTNNYKWNDGTTAAKTIGWTISKKAATVTAKDQTIVYGNEISKGTSYATLTNMISGHTLSEVTLTASIVNAGTGTITASNAKIVSGNTDVTKNYEISYISGTLTIDNAAMTYTASNYTGTYDGNAHKITLNVSNPSSGATIYYSKTELTASNYTSGSTTHPEVKNAGTTTIYYYIVASNYTSVKGSNTITINKKAAEVTASAQTITYGGTIDTSVGKATLTNAVSGHTLNTVTLSASRTTAGTGSITPSAAIIKDASGNDVTSNYNITYTAGTLTINAKTASTLTVTLGTTSYVYDGTAKTPTVTVKDGNTTLTNNTDYTYAITNNTNVGTATVTVTGKGNYTGTKTATFTITRKPIAVPTAVTGLVYNGSAQTGVNAGTGYTLGGTTSATNAGTYTATVTPTANYMWSTDSTTTAKNITWTISEKAVTVTASAQTITYGNSIATGVSKAALASAVSGHTLSSVTLTQNRTDAGTGTITPSAATIKDASGNDVTTNYNITYTAGTLTINAKSASTLTVTTNPTTYVYDGTAKNPTVTVKDGNTTLTNNTDYTYAITNNTNVGTATVTVTGKGNYTGTKTATFTITQADGYVTLSATSSTATYPTETSKTFTISTNHGGTLSVTSSNTSVATASISGTTVTLTIKAAGSTTITVTSAATTNHKAATATYTLTVENETYQVTFNANGGTVTTTSKEVTYNSTYGELPEAERAGAEFIGWFTASTGGTQVTSTTKVAITANQTLYAHWREAVAIYSETDNSLTFYRVDDVEAIGSEYNGKAVTALYTGIETTEYIADLDTGETNVPWQEHSANITSVTFEDEIKPISTAAWFLRFHKLYKHRFNKLEYRECNRYELYVRLLYSFINSKFKYI